jgi:hypothetical protein
LVVPPLGPGALLPFLLIMTLHGSSSSGSLSGYSTRAQPVCPFGKRRSRSSVHLDLFSLDTRMIRFRRLAQLGISGLAQSPVSS